MVKSLENREALLLLRSHRKIVLFYCYSIFFIALLFSLAFCSSFQLLGLIAVGKLYKILLFLEGFIFS